MVDAKYVQFNREPARQILLEWWEALEKDRGDRAVLRRCRSLTEIAFAPAYHRLLKEMGRHFNVDIEGMAIVAGLAAHVKSPNEGLTIAEHMAQEQVPGGLAKVSGLRFRRLLKIQSRDELYPALMRIVALLGGSVNLLSLAEGAYWWGDKIRKDWAFGYYSNAPSEN